MGWNLDHENRERAPADGRVPVPAPWWPVEDEIGEQVRADLDRWAADGEVAFAGDDGPRLFPVTPAETEERLQHFLTHRLRAFGPHQDAMIAGDPWLAMVANVVGASTRTAACWHQAVRGRWRLHRPDERLLRRLPVRPAEAAGRGRLPFTAGYWSFLERNRERSAGNRRMGQPLAALGRLSDLDAVVDQELRRGTRAP